MTSLAILLNTKYMMVMRVEIKQRTKKTIAMTYLITGLLVSYSLKTCWVFPGVISNCVAPSPISLAGIFVSGYFFLIEDTSSSVGLFLFSYLKTGFFIVAYIVQSPVTLINL